MSAAFAALREAGATELVIDLRYNGGGLVDVAVHLGSLIGGTVTNGQRVREFQHNDRNDDLNETLRFESKPQALTLAAAVRDHDARVGVGERAARSTACAPYIPVTVIGDATYGKPVGSTAFNFCDKVLAPVAFTLVNANGQGDYFGGIPARLPGGRRHQHDLGIGGGSLAARSAAPSFAPARAAPRDRRARRCASRARAQGHRLAVGDQCLLTSLHSATRHAADRSNDAAVSSSCRVPPAAPISTPSMRGNTRQVRPCVAPLAVMSPRPALRRRRARAVLSAQNYPNARSGGNYMHNYFLPPAGSSTPWWPTWSPDGQWLAFAMHGSLWRMRVDDGASDGAAEEIAHAAEYLSSPEWSPDGRYLAYTADAGGRSINLRLLDLQSRQSTPLTTGDFVNVEPAWSPDGSRLAYVSTAPNGYFNIFVDGDR